MKLKIAFIFGLTLALIFLGCGEKKKVVDKEKYWEIITSRTLGLAYLEENKLDEAEIQFQKLIELDPETAMGHANLGLVFLRKGEYPEAEKQIGKALKKDSKNPDIRLMLAKVYQLSEQAEKSVNELQKIIKSHPKHIKALYSLAEVYSKARDEKSLGLREGFLEKIVEIAPANIVPRLQLIEVLVRLGKADAGLKNMEEIRRQMPEFPKEAAEFYDKALAALQASNTQEALTPVMVLHNFLKVTSLYQSGILDLKGPGGPSVGFPVVTMGETSTQAWTGESILDALRFTDVTSDVGLAAAQPPSAGKENLASLVSVADFDGDGDEDIYFANASATGSHHFLFQNDMGRFTDISKNAGLEPSGKEVSASFVDYDNDGHLDLYIVKEGANILYRNAGEGKFADVTKESGIGDPDIGNLSLNFDLDHDGDLDFFVAKAGTNLLFRNNSDGTFLEQAEKMSISGGDSNSRDAAFADFDDDGDIDFFVVNEDASNVLYSNLRQGKFEDVTAASGLKSDGGSGAVAVGDYNNDGFPDIFVTGLEGGTYQLFQNKGDGTFKKDKRSGELFKTLQNVLGNDAAFLDFDNDGFLDLLVAGKSAKPSERGLLLFHNDGTGKFENLSKLLPKNIVSARQIALADFNEDGDLDFFVAGLDGSLHLLRNDGGNVNHYLKVQLLGLRTGSSKNNHFGIGAKLEVRAGDLYQMKVVTESNVLFGLGNRTQAEVVRILWTNGVPQNIFSPGTDQSLIEEQELKGSCPFLYTWNGQEFAFATDVMWQSALGMPLGIMGGTTAYAFADASKEYVKIPGEILKPKDGIYAIQMTAELWETDYFDKAELIALDHPDSIDVFVDERFTLPPFPPLRIYSVTEKRTPRTATDEKGNDILPLIRQKDDRYVSNFKSARYQGITEMKDLVLGLGALSQTDSLFLFLNGWIFPTDASINVALSQSTDNQVVAPFLQVINEKGQWETVLPNLGFPMGKNKTMVIDLSGKIKSKDHRIRIRTNMEIYWDYIFFSEANATTLHTRTTQLDMTSADLHYRGFSRMFRKGGRYGPHWFDYQTVSTGQKWRDLIGNYTRFGDVLPLLAEADDKYIIANAGDEISLRFDATALPKLPSGWKRDFVFYSEGWVKDGDLNTAFSKTVEPLPFHSMTRYPYGNEESYPADPEHLNYLKKYNTRQVTTEKFRKSILDFE